MRRLAALALAVALVAVACGDDDAGSGTTEVAVGAPTSTTATTAMTATSTTAPATTTTAVSATTTEVMSNPLLEAASAFAGDYAGQWNNTTFGSTGAVVTTIEVDEEAETATVTMDLGGFVFGGDDPDPIVTVMDLTMEPPYETTNQLLGDATVEFAVDGTLTLTAPAVPGLDGLTLIVEGVPDPAGFAMTYRIDRSDGSVFAEGIMDMAPIG